MTSSTPAYYKEMSLRLSRVLDSVEPAEDIHWKRINMWIQSEEVISLTEATTTPGLNSDIDIVECLDSRAVQDLQNWVPRFKNLIVLSDENTPPGYV
ncbi:hypothetical protein ACJMK2_011832 [Sinanodonta woodiana]|uniref:Uncharacterized protein n=1 Tax=Sinanodonta woodiana TaxID=1069815 RepID=A0ABD3V9F0_SINWO